MGVKKLYCIILHIISGLFLIGIQRAYIFFLINLVVTRKNTLIANLSAKMIHPKVIGHFGQLNAIPMLRVLTLDNALYINPQFYMNSAKASKPEANTEVPT